MGYKRQVIYTAHVAALQSYSLRAAARRGAPRGVSVGSARRTSLNRSEERQRTDALTPVIKLREVPSCGSRVGWKARLHACECVRAGRVQWA